MFSPRDRARGNGHRLKPRELRVSIRKHFFTLRVTEIWKSFPVAVVESQSLEMLKRHLNMVLESLLCEAMLEQGTWTR